VYYMRYSLVADHYEYLAVLGAVACVAAGAARLVRLAQAPLPAESRTGHLLRSMGLNRSLVPPACAAIVALLLGAGAHPESLQYRNAETLYRSTLQRNPSSWLMHNLLGVRLVGTSLDEAVEHFREAVRLNPDLLEAHNNLCQAAESQGRHDEAITECATA